VRGLAVLALLACLPLGCTPTRAFDSAAVQQAALTELFLVRERASALVLWQDSLHAGPVFDSLGLRPTDMVSVPAALPAVRVSLAELEALFRDAPDGWAALYARYAGTPGLVEVGPVAFARGGRSAQLAVARSCGENCRMAWHVQVERGAEGIWRVRSIGPIAAP